MRAASDGTEERLLGALVGVHAGDALGATHEFRSWDEIHRPHDATWRLRDLVGGGPFGWDPGAATDDTDLTLCVLRAYLHEDGFELGRVADAMLAWFDGGPADVGGATAAGLRAYRRSGDPTRAGAGPGAAGNGSLMRCIATGLVRRDGDLLRAESVAVSAVTHDDPRCTEACVAYNTAVTALVDGVEPPVALERARQATDHPEVREAVDHGAALDLAGLAAAGGNPYGGSGFVLHSLRLAVAALLDPRPFEEVVVDVAHLGGDTDTNAAIAGGLRGAADGVAAVPERWLVALEHGSELQVAAPRLSTLRGR